MKIKMIKVFTIIAICFFIFSLLKSKNKAATNTSKFSQKVSKFLGAKKMVDSQSNDEYVEESMKKKIFEVITLESDKEIICHDDINLFQLKKDYLSFEEKCTLEYCTKEEKHLLKEKMFSIQNCERNQN